MIPAQAPERAPDEVPFVTPPESTKKVSAVGGADMERLRAIQSDERYQATLRKAEQSVNRKARRKNGLNDAAKFGHGSMAVPKTRKAPVTRRGDR